MSRPQYSSMRANNTGTDVSYAAKTMLAAVSSPADCHDTQESAATQAVDVDA